MSYEALDHINVKIRSAQGVSKNEKYNIISRTFGYPSIIQRVPDYYFSKTSESFWYGWVWTICLDIPANMPNTNGTPKRKMIFVHPSNTLREIKIERIKS